MMKECETLVSTPSFLIALVLGTLVRVGCAYFVVIG